MASFIFWKSEYKLMEAEMTQKNMSYYYNMAKYENK